MNFKKIVFFVTFVLPSALFTSDHPSKKRKVEETAEKNQLEEAVQLSEKFYQKGEVLDFYGRPSFKVLADGLARYDYVYVENVKTNTKGLLNIRTKLFAVGYTYKTVADLLEDVEKRYSSL